MKTLLTAHLPRRRCGRWALLCGWVALFGLQESGSASGDSRVPRLDSEVVAILRPTSLSAAERELRTLRAQLANDRLNLSLATEVASRLIGQFRIESDPRCLGFAQTALAPWWTNSAPPIELLVLRATLRQSLHDFPAALADLDAALTLDPRHPQAWLTKATIHTVRGEYDKARHACISLVQLTDSLTATTAAATVASLTGDADRSVRLLEAALQRERDVPVAIRVWALTQLAETTSRLGRAAESERHFRTALSLSPRDPYLLGAYADLLLELKRPDEAVKLLGEARKIDGLWLRSVEAHQAAGHETQREINDLEDRFADAQARGDRVHLREEARFHLRLLHRPASALRLALENWEVQKEPADARLLLECAQAANDRAAEARVLTWAATHRLEDVHLKARR